HFAVPETWFVLASIAVIIVGIAVGAIHLSFHGPVLEKLRKSLGIALVIGGAFAVWSYTLAPKLKLPYVYDDEAAAFSKARAEGKGVMVDFSATWCVPCGELDRTFGDDDAYDLITKNFVPLKFDVSDSSATNAERQDRYHAKTLPAVVFLSTDGHTVGRVDHMMEPDELMTVLKPAIIKLHSGGTLAAGEPCR
ncbi:MAG TPA: thioredoxin family protein, partial [Kofleriaceae bacterium]|nr:thioredoxin family protein [Kofleriaceae bacterium]